jgi:hypothetical protein
MRAKVLSRSPRAPAPPLEAARTRLHAALVCLAPLGPAGERLVALPSLAREVGLSERRVRQLLAEFRQHHVLEARVVERGRPLPDARPAPWRSLLVRVVGEPPPGGWPPARERQARAPRGRRGAPRARSAQAGIPESLTPGHTGKPEALSYRKARHTLAGMARALFRGLALELQAMFGRIAADGIPETPGTPETLKQIEQRTKREISLLWLFRGICGRVSVAPA